MRKYLTLAVAALLAAALSPATALAGQEKLDVCHLEGDGTFHLIEVAKPAYFNAHMVHGDAPPGEPVPGMSGYVFDETCQPTEAIEVSLEVGFSNPIGTATADEFGLTFEWGGDTYTAPSFDYHPQYWGTYGLYLPNDEAIPVVDVSIAGVTQEMLTVVFDTYKINSDGTIGTLDTPYVGGSFQYSFLAVEGTTTQVVPAGVVPDASEPYGFLVHDPGELQGLHLCVAKVYQGVDTTGTPLATATGIIDLG